MNVVPSDNRCVEFYYCDTHVSFFDQKANVRFTFKCCTEAADKAELSWQIFGVLLQECVLKTCDAIGLDGRTDGACSYLCLYFTFEYVNTVCVW